MKKKKIDFLLRDVPCNKGPGVKPLEASKELVCIKKDKTTFPASMRISDVKNTRGEVIAKLYLITDLTEKKEMEERLHLSEKLALYSELMGGIAHQLNNPLIGVVNFSEMLLKEMDSDDPRKTLAETISNAGQECLRIIGSVLNCIKDPYLTFSRIDIHEVLTNSLHAAEEQFGELLNRVSIQTLWSPDVSPIRGDDIQLKQCFLNIITNAIQAMPNGGSLKIETKYDKIKRDIKIIFSDTGIGIPNEYLNKIFLPFVSLKKDGEGHGLGLSFAYQIVKNHGGHIDVESEPDLGSTFTITLPAN